MEVCLKAADTFLLQYQLGPTECSHAATPGESVDKVKNCFLSAKIPTQTGKCQQQHTAKENWKL